MRAALRTLLIAALVASLAALGCDKKEGDGGGAKDEPKPAAEQKKDEPAAAAEAKKDEPAPAEGAAAEGEAAEAAAPAADDQPVARAKTAVNKETLAKAYEEIYCAQKQGKTDQILDIYKKYGFDSPKEWTEAWAATSEDIDWQAALTKRVQGSKCE